MPSTSAPFGFQPRRHGSGGEVRPSAYPGGISTGYATAIYKYEPVKLATTGVLNAASGGAEDIIGIFAGVSYVGSDGIRRYSPNWIASTAATEVVAYVWDDPNIVFEVQGAGSYAITEVGDQADVSNGTAGSTTTGLSQCTLGTVVGAGVQGQFRIIGKSLRPENDWGDTYTIVETMIARHQYVAVKVAI